MLSTPLTAYVQLCHVLVTLSPGPLSDMTRNLDPSREIGR